MMLINVNGVVNKKFYQKVKKLDTQKKNNQWSEQIKKRINNICINNNCFSNNNNNNKIRIGNNNPW